MGVGCCLGVLMRCCFLVECIVGEVEMLVGFN